MVAETFGNGECQKETASQQHNGLGTKSETIHLLHRRNPPWAQLRLRD